MVCPRITEDLNCYHFILTLLLKLLLPRQYSYSTAVFECALEAPNVIAQVIYGMNVNDERDTQLCGIEHDTGVTYH